MIFTDFTTTDLQTYAAEEPIFMRWDGTHPASVEYAVQEPDFGGRHWMTVGEARERQAAAQRPVLTYDESIRQEIALHDGDLSRVRW